MKRIMLWAGLFFLASGAATAGAYPRNSLTVEPLGFYFGIANVEFEHMYEHKMAWALRANYMDSTAPDWTGNGVGVGASLRFFPIDRLRAPKGLWFGPSVDTTTTTLTYNNRTLTSLAWGIGGDIGYKFLFGHTLAFVLSPFASVRYWGGVGTVDGVQYPGLHGATFGLGLSLGLGF